MLLTTFCSFAKPSDTERLNTFKLEKVSANLFVTFKSNNNNTLIFKN